jgi:hypothetical protein
MEKFSPSEFKTKIWTMTGDEQKAIITENYRAKYSMCLSGMCLYR